MLPILCPGKAWKFFSPAGHRAIQTLHEVCRALKNSECHYGIISLRFNVKKFPRPVAIRGSWGLVTMKAVWAGTRCTLAEGAQWRRVAHGSPQLLALTHQAFGALHTPHT